MEATKEELIKWIEREQDTDYLNKIQRIKTEADSKRKEFDRRVSDGLTLEEFRQEIHKRIKSWDWKK